MSYIDHAVEIASVEKTSSFNVPDLESYDRILVAFSGGKDSIACVLHLIELGFHDRIELHHHDVDGGARNFMDWPVTPSYCRRVAEALRLPIYFSHKIGGFLGEMSRDDAPTAPTVFELPDGTWKQSGGKGSKGTRGMFPQLSPDLTVRWCSAYLKIDVMATAIRNQTRFNDSRTLVVSGERAEESAARARYKTFEPHRADRRDSRKLARHVDQWRPIHGWSEADVWAIMQRHGVVPHPAYRLGWGRLSCMKCIFGSANQFASIRAIDPQGFAELAEREAASGKTIKRKGNLEAWADAGTPYEALHDTTLVHLAMSETYDEPAVISPFLWMIPAGAYGEKAGPA